MDSRPYAPATLAAQALGGVDPITKAIIPALHPATTYLRDEDNLYRNGRVYARPHNPTFEPPEALLTALEGGAASACFASGMAAATAVFMALKPGDHVLAPKVMYWSLRNWLMGAATAWGLRVELVEMEDVAAVRAAVRPGETALIWAETPANPMWTVSDLAGLAEVARSCGALLAVDSTCATPILTRPLDLGADIVMHSATKYLNGHSDVLAGMLTCRTADDFWNRVLAVRAQWGGILGTFEAWLLQRGMRTLSVRVKTACASALAVARALQEDDRVSAVLYPGLPDHPQHNLASVQMRGGFGGMLSIRLKGGAEAAVATAARTQLWKRATSLGGVESLIEHRSSVEGPTSPVPGDLLRLSVGIEEAADLITDLQEAIPA